MECGADDADEDDAEDEDGLEVLSMKVSKVELMIIIISFSLGFDILPCNPPNVWILI